jgi:alkylation response protein AidB-like acyl-CoA dehydrogenase
MDFRFGSDERDLIEQAARSLKRHLPAARVIAGEPSVEGWRALAEDGWLHAGLPEEQGGSGLPLVMVAAIAREAGMVLAGDAFVDNAVILPRLVGEQDRPAWIDALKMHPGFLLAASSAERPCDSYGVEAGLSAYRRSGATIERFGAGSWTFSPHGGLGLTTGVVALCEGARPDATCTGADDLGDVIRDASIVHAASLIGLGQAAMNDAIEHVKTRLQFGGPIGRFQAVKHIVADVGVQLEVAWNAVLYAALRPSGESVAIACLQASRAADQSSRAMIQLFGGIAMTWEHHAHWYVKVIQTSRRRFGSSSQQALALAKLFAGGEAA